MVFIKHIVCRCLLVLIVLLPFSCTQHSNNNGIPRLVLEGEPIYDHSYFVAIWHTLSKYKHAKNFLIVYLGDFCVSCASGQILLKLNSFQSSHSDTFGAVVLVPSDYTEADIKNLEGNYSFNFLFLSAANELEKHISSILMGEDSVVYGFILNVDSKGIIISFDWLTRDSINSSEFLRMQ